MADYKGLTIQIGGDTTGLVQALKSAKAAGRTTQSELTKIGKALKFNPASLSTMSTKLTLIENKSQSLASQAATTKTAYEQLGNSISKFNGKKLIDIKDSTVNINQEAERARERYNAVNTELEKLNRTMNRVGKQAFQDKNFDVRESTESYDELIAKVEKSVHVNKEMREEFRAAAEEAKRLKPAWQEANLENEMMRNVAALQLMEVEMKQAEAETLELAKQAVKLRISSDVQQSYGEINKQLGLVSNSAESATARVSKFESALSKSPDNLNLLESKFDALAQSIVVNNDKLTVMREKIAQLKKNGAEDTVKNFKDIAGAIEGASENLAKQETELNRLQSKYDDLRHVVRNFQTTKVGYQDSEEYKAAVQNMEAAKAELEEYKQVVEESRAALTKLNEGQEFQSLIDDEKIATANLELLGQSATNTARQIAEIKADGITSDIANATSEMQNLDKHTELLEQDLQKVNSSLQLDSENVELTKRRFDDLAQLVDHGEQKLDLLKSRLSELNGNGAQELKSSFEGTEESVTQAAEKVDSLKSKLKDAEAAYKTAKSVAKEMGSEGSEAAQKQQAEVEKTKSEVTKLTDELNKAEKAYEGEKTVNELKSVEDQLLHTTAKVNNYKQELNKQPAGTGKLFGDINQGMYDIGMGMTGAITAPLVMFARNAIDSAKEVDSAYRDMRKTVDGTEQQFKDLRQSAIDFSTTHVTSAQQIMDIQAIGGELGIATTGLKTFAETVSNLDIATNLSTEDAATGLGQLANIMDDLNEKNMPQFADAMVRLGNNGASTEEQIMDIAKRIGSMGSILGFTTPEVLAWASSIASTGQNTEAAGTAISKTMSDIENSVAGGAKAMEGFNDINTLSADDFAKKWGFTKDKAKKNFEEMASSCEGFAKVAGMSAEDFAKKWKEKPSEAMKDFVQGLRNIKDNGGSVDATLEDLGITSVRQKQALEGLTQTIGTLDGNLTMSNDAWNGVSDQWGAAGDAAREADAKAQGFSGTMAQLGNIAQNFGAEVGDAITPFVHELKDDVELLFNAFKSLSPETKLAIAKFAGFAAAAGPVIMVSGRLAKGLKNLFDGFKMAASGVGLLSSGLGGLAIAGVIVTVGFLAQKVMELAVEEEKAKKKQETYNGAMRDLGDVFNDAKNKAQGMTDTVDEISTTADNTLQSLKDLKDKGVEELGQAFADSAMLDNAVGVIEDLGGKSNLTKSEQEKLAAAVDSFNKITGDSVEIVDAENGKLSESIDKLKEVASQYKNLAKQKAYQNIAQDSYNKMAEFEIQLPDAKKQQADARKKLEDFFNSTGSGGKFTFGNFDNFFEQAKSGAIGDWWSSRWGKTPKELQDMAIALQNANDNVSALTNGLANLQTQADAASIAADWYAKGADSFFSDKTKKWLSDSGESLDEFINRLSQAGITMDDFKKVSDDTWSSIKTSSKGNIETAINWLEKLNSIGLTDKNYTVSDQGTVELANGLILNLNTMKINDKNFTVVGDNMYEIQGMLIDLNNQTIAGKHFEVNDDGTITIAELGIRNLNWQQVFDKLFNINADPTNAVNALSTVDQQSSLWAKLNPETKIGADNKGALDSISNATNSGKDFQNDTFKTTLDANKKPVYDAIAAATNAGNAFAQRVFTATLKMKREDAAGGITHGYLGSNHFRSAMYNDWHNSNIRRHADGAIVNRPTFVGSNDIAGEAGAEAIIPLTNKRYARPFANNIAELVAGYSNHTETEILNELRLLRTQLPQLMEKYQSVISILQSAGFDVREFDSALRSY